MRLWCKHRLKKFSKILVMDRKISTSVDQTVTPIVGHGVPSGLSFVVDERRSIATRMFLC